MSEATAAPIGIAVEHVWKKFHRGEFHDSLRDLVPAVVKRLTGRGPRSDELAAGDFWALQNVSFQVRRGEALGIIGPNGAGKSTVLKLLTRILRPTKGQCHVRGRVGALIEIAAGFHPDLTGRENVFLQGVIMGLKRADLARKLDEIVEFAGVGAFLDTPVKRYSSGMNARLGFSIAAHLDPDVLLIDEVLSVGDMAFQEKCVVRMKDFKRQGVAIVFVSHNLEAVSGLCDHAIYLNSAVCAAGPTQAVLREYVRGAAPRSAPVTSTSVLIEMATLLDDHGHAVSVASPSSRLTLRVVYQVREALSDVHFGFIVRRSTDGLVVYDGSFFDGELGLRDLQSGRRIVLDFGFRTHLTRGQYHFEVHVAHNATHTFLARLMPAAILSVEESRTYAGVADLEVACGLVASTTSEVVVNKPSIVAAHR